MKIAFYLNNEQLEGLDWTHVLTGNPGAGGTEFMVVLEACLMSKEKVHEVVLYVSKQSVFPDGMNIKYVSCLKEAINDANANFTDYIVYKETQKDGEFSFLKNIPQYTGHIVWCHNFLSKKALDVYATENVVKSVICVGREMLDLYRDEKCFSKMDYIYNGCILPDITKLPTRLENIKLRQNIVTYIGSIVPSKSFHWLAKAWPNVLKRVPDAQLYVIGSGNLYDKNAKLGKYGVASEEYERLFMPFLTNKAGDVLPSVHFLGKMGKEKNEIIKKTKVGVPNPSGESETFGITAVEMQSLGCHVVTMKCPGYLDTVINKDNLYSKPYSLSSYIVNGLINPNDDFQQTYTLLRERFAYNVVHKDWLSLFAALKKGKCRIHDLDHDIPNLGYEHKWLRVIMGIVNRLCSYKLPTELKLKGNRLYCKYNWYKKKLSYYLVK